MNTLDPKISQNLMSHSEDARALVAFIRAKVDELSRIPNTKGLDAEAIALEVKARDLATQILFQIVSPLLNTTDKTASNFNAQEYTM